MILLCCILPTFVGYCHSSWLICFFLCRFNLSVPWKNPKTARRFGPKFGSWWARSRSRSTGRAAGAEIAEIRESRWTWWAAILCVKVRRPTWSFGWDVYVILKKLLLAVDVWALFAYVCLKDLMPPENQETAVWCWCFSILSGTTVDGRNPAPVDR